MCVGLGKVSTMKNVTGISPFHYNAHQTLGTYTEFLMNLLHFVMLRSSVAAIELTPRCFELYEAATAYLIAPTWMMLSLSFSFYESDSCHKKLIFSLCFRQTRRVFKTAWNKVNQFFFWLMGNIFLRIFSSFYLRSLF